MKDCLKDIAERIIGLRLLTGTTESEIAANVNLTVEQYIKYENAEDDIPVSILYEISCFYGVDMTEILTGVSPKLHDVCFVRKGEGIKTERYDQYDFFSLAYKYAGRKIEPLLVTLTEDNDPEPVSHNGQEFNYCLEGSMKVIVGNEEYLLEAGDALYFNPIKPHRMLATGGQPAKFLTVILL